jgi:DNA-binding IclR family transcriptional regulator
MGWLLLSDLTEPELVDLYGKAGLRALTSLTPTDIPALVERTRTAAARGFVLSHGVLEPGGSSIAVPVLGPDGKVAAAIDIAGPDSAFNLAEFEKIYLGEVLATARAISARLGYVPPAP